MRQLAEVKLDYRRELATIIPECGIAIELGVARGEFSSELLEHGPQINTLYSVDMWAGDRGHGITQYKKALDALVKWGVRSVVIRATFDEAIELFEDDSIDFIYADGYAHNAQESGTILEVWWPKLKINGIFAGHDYDNKWPRNVRHINKFAKAHGLKLQFTTEDEYASWYARKYKT